MDEPVAPSVWPLVDRRTGRPREAPGGVERRRRPDPTVLDQLAEANQLLVALSDVAASLPTSLDLDQVLDSCCGQVSALVGGDTVTLLLRDAELGAFVAVRGARSGLVIDPLPSPIEAALGTDDVVVDTSGDVLAVGCSTGVYVAARTRGQVIAVIAAESREVAPVEADKVEVLQALAQTFAVAIDNARLFRRVRLVAADAERRRLAREVHDRIGSSVALLGFELDRVIAETRRGTEVEPLLAEMRTLVSTVVGQVRETLNDLRTDVTPGRDLESTLRAFLDRLAARSGLVTHLDSRVEGTLPLTVERELWHIALEALVNVERHSAATNVWVTWAVDDDLATLVVRDDGKGLEFGAGRADSYGLTGMRERASMIGARLDMAGVSGSGTTVTVTIGHSMP